MMVELIYMVLKVGLVSGNINFDGNVVIKGDVDVGMMVCVIGDIEIGGVVDLVILEVGGNIVVKGGVIGLLVYVGSGNYYICCGGIFNVMYVQQVIIEVGDSIFIDDMVLQCELLVFNYIIVGYKQCGYIIGGLVWVMLLIIVKVIGLLNQGYICLEIGVNLQIWVQ